MVRRTGTHENGKGTGTHEGKWLVLGGSGTYENCGPRSVRYVQKRSSGMKVSPNSSILWGGPMMVSPCK